VKQFIGLRPEAGALLDRKDGEIVGSAFLIHTQTVAQLRLMLVGPRRAGWASAPGWWTSASSSPGKGLPEDPLWTNSILLAARHIYKKAGFRLVHKERHHSFGHALVGETWDLPL
jgi:hypothetical protein